MAKITVIGSFVMDNVAKMKKYPEAGETVLGYSLGLFPGGKGANQCVAAARLGGDVEMIGMLGKDGNGDVFRKILKDEGIKCDNVFSCDVPTAIAQIQINDEGQNLICVIPCANHEFGFEHLDKVDEVIKNSLVNYKLNRLSYVDRAIIRMATAEMMMGTAVAVVINEALEIVKVYSDQGDGNAVRFINKVLDNVSKNIER